MTKAILIAISLWTALGCSQFQNKESGEAVQEFQDTCSTFVAVGRVKICLPAVDSMVEQYTDSLIKVWADGHEIKGNTILSLYLHNPARYHTTPSGQKNYDDYFKIYQVDNLKDLNVDEKYLTEVADAITTTNTFFNWGETQKKLETDYKFITPDQPYFIDHYSPHPHVRSFVTLYRYSPEGAYETLLLGVMNIMLIKKRLVGLTYYKAFTGYDVLSRSRTINDAIVSRVMAVNGE